MTSHDDPPCLSLAEVERIARTAHAAQVDSVGLPMSEHLAAVAAATASYGGDAEQLAAAWLHDTVEHGALPAAWLEAAPLPQRVKAIVVALTRDPGESAAHYIGRIRSTPGARTVKGADLAANTRPDRLARLDAPTRARLLAKYEEMRRLLYPDPTRRPARGSGVEGDPSDVELLAGLDRSGAAAGAWVVLHSFASGWTVKPEDVVDQDGSPAYGPRVDAVTGALSAVRAVTPTYHWTAYAEPTLAADGTLTPADAVRAATAVVRGERFSDGTIGAAWKNGRLYAVVHALVGAAE
jgi:hypothetical protein